MKKKVVRLFICMTLIFSICQVSGISADAKVTKKGMKFLKGTWLTVGDSQGTKIIFSGKYMKAYSLWNSDYSKVRSPKKRGKYLGKCKVLSTTKKGKTWTIKVKGEGDDGYTYYKGYGYGLECWWKEDGEWMYSASSSLQRYSKKVYK